MKIHRRCHLLVLTAALTLGCGAGPTPDASTDTARAHTLRVAAADLRGRPGAERLTADIERAELWLQRAEIARTAGDYDPGRITLWLDAAEVQLGRVKSSLARAAAEESLAERQARYGEQRERIETYRSQTEAAAAEEGRR